MSRLGINTGSNPNDGQGDPLRVAMGKINSNFQEIYNTLGDGTTLASYVSTAGIATLAQNLTGNPRINVSGILNTGITTTEHIEVRNITSTGVVTATQFVGDGSQLSNVTALVAGLQVLDDNVRKGIARELNFGNNIESTGPDGVGRVTISVTSTPSASYASYASTSGISTLSRGLTGTPNINVGVVTATSYYGNGSQLTGLPPVGWTTSSVGIYTSANVGIGTTAKSNYTLDVNAPIGNRVSIASTHITIGNMQYYDANWRVPSFVAEVSNDDPIDPVIIPLGSETFTIQAPTQLRYSCTIGTSFFPYQRGVFIDGIRRILAVGAGITMNGRTGIITANSVNILNGGLDVSGIVTATAFIGDGSGLTGIVGGGESLDQTLAIGNTSSLGMSVGVVTATRFESSSGGAPTIGAATTISMEAINVAISTDATIGRNLNVSGVVTATSGFISVGNTTPIQISLVGNQLTFTAVGIGSTTLTLF